MFLATTALEEFWDTSGHVLFLGEWCRLYRRRHVWSALPHDVLPYHWDDRERLLRDFGLIEALYEANLASLADQLNQVHGTDFSLRYWRIVLGPWLRYFLEIAYDRYLSIEAAARSGRVTRTRVGTAQPEDWVPHDFRMLKNWSLGDEYNQHLYGQMIRRCSDIPFEPVRVQATPSGLARRRLPRPHPQTIAVTALAALSRIVPALSRGIIFDASYFRASDVLRLQRAFRQVGVLRSHSVRVSDVATDVTLRSDLRVVRDATPFTRVLEKLLPFSVPKAYLEAYKSLHARAVRHFPSRPISIFTANAYHTDEAFKLWAAFNVECGTSLLIGQHGGMDGMGLFSSTEDHETAISDKYLSWGWSGINVTPVPSQMLQLPPVRRNRATAIYWNLNINARYSAQFLSLPFSPQWLEYLQSLIAFARQLQPEARRRLICRPHWIDYDWSVAERLRDELGVTIDHRRGQWHRRLRSAALAIETTNLTTLLQSMAANVPTVLMLNPRHWELRPAAAESFEGLAEAGIMFAEPGPAAEKVNEIFLDPRAWWEQPTIQTARQRFCRQFALTSTDWIDVWRRELSEFRYAPGDSRRVVHARKSAVFSPNGPKT